MSDNGQQPSTRSAGQGAGSRRGRHDHHQSARKAERLSRALIAELVQALGDLHQERRVRAVILTGAGSAFCAGMDLAEMAATANSQDPHAHWHEDAIHYRELLDTMLHFPKPIIAAVAGPAMAGGAGLVLAADIVVAGPSATFGLPEIRRGLVAGIVAPLLAFRIGAGRAGSSAAHGQRDRRRRSLSLWAGTRDRAGRQSLGPARPRSPNCAPRAHRKRCSSPKRILNETIGEQLGMQLSIGAAASATARTTEAAAEGLAAFLEKRPPEWK